MVFSFVSLESRIMDPEDADYKCTFSPSTLEKAMKELNEDPKQRLGQTQALRNWVKEQPHFVCRTDTKFLLAVLRRAKFSQLKARELIENILTAKTMFPEFVSNIDVHDPELLGLVEEGLIVHLPKPDKEGRRILLFRGGPIDLDDPKFSPVNEFRYCVGLAEMFREAEEEIYVHGCIMVFDLTGIGASHLARMRMDLHRDISKIYKDSNQERVKAIHVYNAGTLLEMLLDLVKQLMKNKHLDRLHVHNTMESLYKVIPMELWPTEYLPDDYKEPSAGSIESIQAATKKRLMDPGLRQRILEYTHDRYKIDESKRQAGTPNE